MRRGEGLLELLLTPVAAARPLAHASREWLPSERHAAASSEAREAGSARRGTPEGAVSVSSPL